MNKFFQRALKKVSKLNREQVEELLAHVVEENEMLGVLLNSLVKGIFVSNIDHKLILFNKAAERLLPLISADLLERKVWTVINDTEISRFYKNALEAQEKIEDKEFAISHGGINKYLSCTLIPLVREGAIQGNVFLIEDITEKKGKEARLRRAESLASLTTLAAGVAHEIKNPLGSIGIHIQLIQKALNNGSTLNRDVINQYLEIVNEEVDRLNRIIVDFLFAVRPMDTQLEPNDLNRIIKDVVRFLQFELEDTHVEHVLELKNIPDVLLDVRFIKQAILNIIKNAVHAMPNGGKLFISTMQEGNEVFLSIKDTGLGIPKEIMEKIFEPYFTTKDYGSGLGLTVVYKIIKEHMGDIQVLSKDKEGTTFIMCFPVPQKEKHLLSWEGDKDEL